MTNQVAIPAPSRAQVIWQVTAQLAVVALLVTALILAPGQKPAHTALLALLGATWLVVLLVPAWRFSEFTGFLGGLTLATACWFSAGVTITIPNPDVFDQPLTDFIPRLTPCVAGTAIVLAVWGAFARTGLSRQACFGLGAVAAGLLLLIIGIKFYIYFGKMMKYTLEPGQLAALLSAVIIYAAALWLGGMPVKSTTRWPILHIGALLAIGAFVLHLIGGKAAG